MAFNQIARAKNALDNRKITMSVPCPSAKGKYSALMWNIVNNNPRITVFTNDPADSTDGGKISANMDIVTFYAFIELIKQMCAFDGETKVMIENKNFIFPGGKRSDQPVVVSELWVGKDKEGIVWISVTAKDRPRIKFPFGFADFHVFKKADGTPYTKAEMSVIAAQGYIEILQRFMAQLAVDNYVEPPKKQQTGGGGSNYSNNNNSGGNSGGGGGNKSFSDDSDDDIPF